MQPFDGSAYDGYDPAYWQDRIFLEPRENVVIEHYRNIHRIQAWYAATMERESYPLSAHQQIECMYCASDEPVEHFIGSERYLFKKGDIILLDSFTPHCLLIPEGKSVLYKRYGLLIDRNYYLALCKDFPDTRAARFLERPVIHLDPAACSNILALFEQTIGELRSDRIHSQLYAESLALQILCLTIRAALSEQARPVTKERDELADRIAAYIEEHYTEPITLESAARHLFVSKSTVSHTIKKKLGVSFYAYVSYRRMLAARVLISQGTPALEASVRVGFSDYTAFLRLFKKTYGITPRQIKPTAAPDRP